MSLVGSGAAASVWRHGDTVRKQFRRERQYTNEKVMLTKAQGVANTIKLIGHDDQKRELVMEFMPFVLEDAIIANEFASSRHKCNILMQIGRFILECSARNIVHNDLKAKNILLNSDKTALKVVDFDLACESPSNIADVKKFKFIILQMVFGLDYKTCYTKKKLYIKKTKQEQLFESDNIGEILTLVPNLFI